MQTILVKNDFVMKTTHLCLIIAVAIVCSPLRNVRGLPADENGEFIRVSMANAAETETPSSTPAEVFDGMRKSFQADKAKGVHVRYQFKFSGPNGGDWWIIVDDGTFKMGRGKIDNPSARSAQQALSM